MGKGRADTMDVDRVTKKKVSEDKVTKHEGKRTKTMRHIKLEDSDDESEKVGLKSPEQAHENALTLRPDPSTLEGDVDLHPSGMESLRTSGYMY